MARRQQISAAEARRIALAAQGFAEPRPSNANDIRHFRRVLRAITVLQLDFVNVLLPAHYLMIWSRIGAYNRNRFEKWLYDSGEFTEQWAHEASIVAREDWPLLAHRRAAFEQHKNSPLNRLPNRTEYLENVLRQVHDGGAVTSSDLPPIPTAPRKKGDWHRSIPRWALEQHFGRGSLAVRKRMPNFQRVYDLPERLLSRQITSSNVSATAAQRELVRKSAHALGIATLHDIADYYRMTPTSIAAYVEDLVETGELQPVSVSGWGEPAFLSSRARFPRKITGASLLSPFDPMVWFRPRAQRLFDFEYRIEIYVPAAKRRWGYYVLPFREGDRITARVDLKADRQNSRLLIQAAHVESAAGSDTAKRLAQELRELACWLNLDSFRTSKTSAFEKALARELT